MSAPKEHWHDELSRLAVRWRTSLVAETYGRQLQELLAKHRPERTPYEDAKSQLLASIRLGVLAEVDSGLPVPDFVDGGMEWLAAWLAGDGFAKEAVPSPPEPEQKFQALETPKPDPVRFLGGPLDGFRAQLSRTPTEFVAAHHTYVRLDDPDTGEPLGAYVLDTTKHQPKLRGGHAPKPKMPSGDDPRAGDEIPPLILPRVWYDYTAGPTVDLRPKETAVTIKFNPATKKWELHNAAGVVSSSRRRLVLERKYPDAKVVEP